MPDNLLMKYDASDTGVRPVPANATFWLSPDVTLATPDGNYTVGTATPVNVSPNLIPPLNQAYQVINVQVWVCDPTTNATPASALYPSNPVPVPPARTLSSAWAPMDQTQPLTSIPTITVDGFVPWNGMSNLPGGHCCLVANCYGTLGDGTTSFGQDLTSTLDDLIDYALTVRYAAQHNIFADVTQSGTKKMIIFPFHAATHLKAGEERVTLTMTRVETARLTLPFPPHVKQLSHSRFIGLPLHISHEPPRLIGLRGVPGRDAGHEVALELTHGAGHLLTAEIELSPRDRPGAVHVFDVVQRDHRGKVQGGLRLIAVAGH